MLRKHGSTISSASMWRRDGPAGAGQLRSIVGSLSELTPLTQESCLPLPGEVGQPLSLSC
eukprot:7024242-Alexandrium_andersonii.AAC.1